MADTVRARLEAIRDRHYSYLLEDAPIAECGVCCDEWPCADHKHAVAALALLDAAEVEHYSDVVPDYGGNLARRYRLIPDPDQPDA